MSRQNRNPQHSSLSNMFVRRAVIAVALASGLFAFGAASAADKEVLSPAIAGALKRDLKLNDAQLTQYFRVERDAYINEAQAERQLGSSYAGSWIERDADGGFKFVIATSGSAKLAAASGIEVRQHRYSLRQLDAAIASLDALHSRALDRSKLAGVYSWYVDVPSNSVVLTVAPGSLRAAVDFIAISSVDAQSVRFKESTEQAPTHFANVTGGNEYQSGGGLCSIGFAVTLGATKGFATAGHCGGVGTTVSLGGVTVGSIRGQYYPPGDQAWANVRSTDTLRPRVNRYNGTEQSVLGSTRAAIGAAICRSGRTTGWRCGSIVSRNVSVNYGAGTVNGLTQSTACAGRGDSGGSWITGSGQAQGVTSGGQLPAGQNSNCSVATPVTWFQPINPILRRFGLTLVI
jgi:alpha-lytic endopeptidase